jgi:hypothetical protein
LNLTEMQGGTFTLYAKWRTVPTYSVSYRHGENGVGSRQTVSKSESVPLVLRGAIFKRNGYEQTGWTTVDGGAKEYDLGATYSDDASVTLYPSWVANTYTVKFDSNGGTGTMSDLAMTYDVAVSLPENAFAKSGSRFAGWAKTASGSVTYGNCASVKNLTTVNDGTVVLYAKWLTGSSGSSAGSGSGGSAGGGSSGGGSAGGSGASGGSSGSGGSGSGSGSGASGGGASGGVSSGGTPSSGIYISSCGWHGAAPMSVASAWTAKKAATLNGALYGSDCNVAGVVQLKVAKPTTKKGVTTAKVSGYVMLMDGKRKSVKSVKVEVPNGGPITVAATVKDLGTLTATIGDDGFTGTVGGYSVQTASVGGSWTKSGTAVAVDFAGGSALPDGTIAELLPNGEPVLAKGGKWAFEKSASVKLKNGALVGTDDPKKPNLSAMKLAYAPKTGIFKGSFKIYAVQGGKLKNFSVKVNGFVVEGTGCGRATLAKPQSSWSVSVE